MNILPSNLRFGAGQSVRRLEDQRLVTGQGRFSDDRAQDGNDNGDRDSYRDDADDAGEYRIDGGPYAVYDQQSAPAQPRPCSAKPRPSMPSGSWMANEL